MYWGIRVNCVKWVNECQGIIDRYECDPLSFKKIWTKCWMKNETRFNCQKSILRKQMYDVLCIVQMNIWIQCYDC